MKNIMNTQNLTKYVDMFVLEGLNDAMKFQTSRDYTTFSNILRNNVLNTMKQLLFQDYLSNDEKLEEVQEWLMVETLAHMVLVDNIGYNFVGGRSVH